MSTDGPFYAGTVTSNNSNSPTGNGWTSPSNAQGTSDANYASVSVDSGDESEYLHCVGFSGWTIPSGATIDGITVEVNRKIATSTGTCLDAKARIIKNSVIGTTDKASATNWTTTLARITYGGPTDKWGLLWADTDINSTFGFALSVTRSGSSRTFQVDDVRITVNYTAGGGSFTATMAASFGPATAVINATSSQSDLAASFGPMTAVISAGSSESDLVASFGALTASISGNSIGFVGAVAASFGSLTADIQANTDVYGAVDASFGPLSAAIAGSSVEDVGAVSASFGPLAADITANASAQGTLAASFGPFAATITALYGDGFATVSASFGPLTASIDATVSASGILTASFGSLTASLSSLTAGAMPESFLAASFGHFTATTFEGTIDVPVYTADLVASFGPLTWTTIGPTSGTFADYIGALNGTFGPLTAAIDAFFVPTLNFSGAVTASFGSLTATTFTGAFIAAVEHFPALGGIRITGVTWLSPGALRLDFETVYTDVLYQVYAGRQLVGVSATTDSLFVVAAVFPSHWPQWITLLAVEPDDGLTEFGPDLPKRPYNRVRIHWDTSGWNNDAKFSQIAASSAPDDPVDPENVLSLEEFDTDGAHTFLTKPLPGSGVWSFTVAGRDQRPPAGNLGDDLDLSAEILSTPPDCRLHGDGTRLTAAVAAGVLTLSFDYDWRGT